MNNWLTEFSKLPPFDWTAGDCFSNACSFLFQLAGNSEGPQGTLVHGLILKNSDATQGCRIAHAWIEVTLGGNLCCIDLKGCSIAGAYYAMRKPTEIVKYTDEEASNLIDEHGGKTGPWDARFNGYFLEPEPKKQPRKNRKQEDH